MSSVAAGFTLLFVALGSWSMPHVGGHDFNPEDMSSFLSRKLDFTEEQEAAVNNLLTASHEESEPDLQRLQTLDEQLRNHRGTFDEVAAREAADEIGEITARMVFLKVSTFAEITALLTQEQREQAAELREKRAERRGMWRDHI